MDELSTEISLSDEVVEAIRGLDIDRSSLLSSAKRMCEAYDGAVYLLDLYANGATNRALSLSHGFESMVRCRNILCAGAILRLQLDTAIRFAAAWLVASPNDFVLAVLNGTQVRKIKDQSGELMTDAYLVKSLASDYPWLPKVYETTSGYIHLSETHIASTVTALDPVTKRMAFQISHRDEKQPDSLYLEAIAAFRAATRIFEKYLEGWIFTKDNPTVIEAMRPSNEQRD